MRNRPIGDIGRRRFVSGSALALLGAAGTTLAPLDALAFGSDEHEDAPNQHNMLVVGEQAVFLSHLPMFQAGKPRRASRRQDGKRVHVAAPVSGDPRGDLRQKRQGRGGRVCPGSPRSPENTHLHPGAEAERAVRALAPVHAGGSARTPSFTGTVFRGHLEQGGEPIAGLDSSLVTITRVVHARKMTPRQARPAHLEYILFGKGSELFLAHAIYAPPDFDQVCSI